MKPILLLTLVLATVLRAAEPAAAALPAKPAEPGASGATPGQPTAGPATAATVPPPAPVLRIESADPGASPAMQQVNATLPKYDPAAAEASKPTNNTPNPDALELPKITVRPKPRPRLVPAAVITNKGLEEKASPLDAKLLNKFTLPSWMGGQTAADRAREEEQRKKKDALAQDVNTMAKALDTTDPTQAKALRDAVAKP